LDITYEKDLPPDLGQRMRGREQWLNWLHPVHGPFPDLLGELRATMEDNARGAFIGAAWLTEKAILTAIEAVEMNEERDIGLGSRILRTYRWTPNGGGPAVMVCGARMVPVPEQVLPESPDDEWAWKRGIMISVLRESVWLNINTKVGEIMRGNELRRKRHRALPKPRKVY